MKRRASRLGLVLGAIVALMSAANAAEPEVPQPSSIYFGRDHVTVDLLRPGKSPGARQRIYVQAKLPNGELGLFLVDTGAGVSVLSEELAEKLGLTIQRDWGSVEGLSGVASFHHAVIPSLQIGGATLPDVEVAVGVRGVQDTAGAFMPLAGILGTNVWQRFIMEIDYPADKLILHRPGTRKLPRRSDPLWFEENKVFVPLGMWTKTEPSHRSEMIIQVDTGAGGLMIMGSGRLQFAGSSASEKLFTQGLEPIYGLGAADTLPSSSFLKTTRRIPLETIEFGGRKTKLDIQAQWLDWDAPRGSAMTGLAGHEMMDGHRVFFDFQAGRFAVTGSLRAHRKMDGNAVLLAQDIAKYGDDSSRDLFRAKMHTALEHYDQADALLEKYLSAHAADGEARVLLASVRRYRGNLAGAWDALRPIAPADLVAEGEIVAAVNGLLLDGHNEEALRLADEAIAAYDKRPRPPPERAAKPEEFEPLALSSAYVARADALLAARRTADANAALLTSATLADNPDAQLLRRARVALASGDRYGAMADIRKLIQLYPTNGQYLWFYATLLTDGGDSATFRQDMADAMGRLHETTLPLDYLVISHHIIGDQPAATKWMAEGLDRDCFARGTPKADRENCSAWYHAMAGVELESALSDIDRALAVNGPRSDYLDTKAMVLLSRGDYDKASTVAREAARMSPDDVYMLWQAERIAQMAETHKRGQD